MCSCNYRTSANSSDRQSLSLTHYLVASLPRGIHHVCHSGLASVYDINDELMISVLTLLRDVNGKSATAFIRCGKDKFAVTSLHPLYCGVSLIIICIHFIRLLM